MVDLGIIVGIATSAMNKENQMNAQEFKTINQIMMYVKSHEVTREEGEAIIEEIYARDDLFYRDGAKEAIENIQIRMNITDVISAS